MARKLGFSLGITKKVDKIIRNNTGDIKKNVYCLLHISAVDNLFY